MTVWKKTVSGLAKPYREQYELTHHLQLALGTRVFELRSNSERLVARLQRYFREFVTEGAVAECVIDAFEAPPLQPEAPLTPKPPDPGKRKLKEEYAELQDGRLVRKRLTGMVFLFGAGQHLAIGPCTENDNQVINFLNNRLIQRQIEAGGLLFHAAGVALGGQGLALAGFSGRGKSTLALHLMRRDMDFVSNDRLTVGQTKEGLLMCGVPKMPRVNPGTLLHNPSLRSILPPQEQLRLASLAPEQLWNLEEKYDALIDECFGPGRFRLEVPMKGLVLLNWKHGAGPVVSQRIALSQRDDLWPAFMKTLGLFYLPASTGATAHPSSLGPLPTVATPESPLASSIPATHPSPPNHSATVASEEDLPPSPVAGANPPPEAYLDLLRDCPIIELSGGIDFDEACHICLDFLRL